MNGQHESVTFAHSDELVDPQTILDGLKVVAATPLWWGHESCYVSAMVIKESSDELSLPAATSSQHTSEPIAHSPKDYFALALATCGVGYFPLAPGTWGSLLAVGIYWLVRIATLSHPADAPKIISNPGFVAGEMVVIVLVTICGIWAASRTERVLKVKDPGKVVIDEVAGQLIALLPLPLTGVGPSPVLVVVAFLLFRFFDIVKPYPARKFESLHGGLGIMADDLVAGIYAAICVVVVSRFI